MDYERVSLAVAEMLDIGYSYEWSEYLMNIFGVPKSYPRPTRPKSKYLFFKDLFRELGSQPETRDVVLLIADYIVQSERFDERRKADALKHLPVFKMVLAQAGYSPPEDRSMRVIPYFQERRFELDSRRCFVIMPFRPEWANRIYNRVLKPTCEACDLDVVRADDMFGHEVMEDVWRALNEAFVIIADVTGRNANVFYELGIAHTLGKNVIVITQHEEDIPFDIARFRYIKYADNLDGYEILQQQIPRFVAQIRSPAERRKRVLNF